MNNIRRINPNEELKELSKYDARLRKSGFNNMQILQIKQMVIQNQRETEFQLCEYIPFVMICCMGNVLHGNKYLSKNKITLALHEACVLYNELDQGLLDVDDAIKYNEDNLGLKIEVHHRELWPTTKAEVKIGDFKSVRERVAEVFEAENKRLEGLVESAKEASENGDCPEVLEAAYTFFKEYNSLKDQLKKAGVL